MNGRWGFSGLVFLAAIGAAVLCAAEPAFAQRIDEFSVPSGGKPLFIAPGPGGMWFTEVENRIGRINPEGRISEFPISSPAWRIVAGPDGNLWFTSEQFLSRMTPDGAVTNFAISGRAWGITAGRDGNIWFTELQRNESAVNGTLYGILGRATPAGQITEVLIEPWAEDIAAAADGAFWLPDWTELGGDAIVHVTPSGGQTRFPLPGGLNAPGDVGPSAVAVASDGNIWFVLTRTLQIGRMTPAGSMEIFDLAAERGIAAGSDGNVWFTSMRNNAIGRLTPGGELTAFSVSSPGALPWGIAEDPAGNIWFTERGSARIARLALRPERVSPAPSGRQRPAPGGPPGPRR
jgi:virginiamycin B lyase